MTRSAPIVLLEDVRTSAGSDTITAAMAQFHAQREPVAVVDFGSQAWIREFQLPQLSLIGNLTYLHSAVNTYQPFGEDDLRRTLASLPRDISAVYVKSRRGHVDMAANVSQMATVRVLVADPWIQTDDLQLVLERPSQAVPLVVINQFQRPRGEVAPMLHASREELCARLAVPIMHVRRTVAIVPSPVENVNVLDRIGRHPVGDELRRISTWIQEQLSR